ncbi:MAG: hypothetical protein RI894_1016 [Bacteroidota bacterium]
MVIRILTVVFVGDIARSELSAFRGAMAEKAGLEHELFHNHNNAEGAATGYHYRYPLIQYKLLGKQPTLVCVNEGIEGLQVFFGQADWTLTMRGRPIALRIADMQLQTFSPSVAAGLQHRYRLVDWQALNQKNYADYKVLDGLVAQTAFLQKKLIGCIIAFASGIDWFIETPIEVIITGFAAHSRNYKQKTAVMTFDVQFKTNVQLPLGIGIGKGASLGFGVLACG